MAKLTITSGPVRFEIENGDADTVGDILALVREQGLLNIPEGANPVLNGDAADLDDPIEDGDELIDVQLTSGADEIILATRDGLAIRFYEEGVREMGRATTSVRGIRLRGRDEVVGLVVVGPETREEATLLAVTEKGRGKRSPVDDYRLQARGGPTDRGGARRGGAGGLAFANGCSDLRVGSCESSGQPKDAQGVLRRTCCRVPGPSG